MAAGIWLSLEHRGKQKAILDWYMGASQALAKPQYAYTGHKSQVELG